jgi:hypothetical protein
MKSRITCRLTSGWLKTPAKFGFIAATWISANGLASFA